MAQHFVEGGEQLLETAAAAGGGLGPSKAEAAEAAAEGKQQVLSESLTTTSSSHTGESPCMQPCSRKDRRAKGIEAEREGEERRGMVTRRLAAQLREARKDDGEAATLRSSGVAGRRRREVGGGTKAAAAASRRGTARAAADSSPAGNDDTAGGSPKKAAAGAAAAAKVEEAKSRRGGAEKGGGRERGKGTREEAFLKGKGEEQGAEAAVGAAGDGENVASEEQGPEARSGEEGHEGEIDTGPSILPLAASGKETQSAPAALGQVAAAAAAVRQRRAGGHERAREDEGEGGKEKEEAEIQGEDEEECQGHSHRRGHPPAFACMHGVAAEDAGEEKEKKPHFFSLCTKCAHEGKRGPHERREPVRGLIIRSESFMNASDASRWEVEQHCSGSSTEAHPPFRPPLHAQQHDAGRSSSSGGSGGGRGGLWAGAADAEGRGGGGEEAATGHSSPPGGPVFDRSRIVHEVLLEGGHQITDIFDISNGVSLGKGSYGSVVKAKDLKTNIMRAVKVVYKPRIENVTRLKREILIMKRLDHPNIIKLLEVYEDLKNLYLVMELCTGGELFERIIKSGHFSERYAASLMKQVFSAASYCHSQNVIHRDLKPENLLYADSSPLSALKVIDWGFAARCGKSHKFSSVVGTPYYVAPEVLFGKYGSECDMWSAGVILYILLCGYPPFHGKDNQEILKKVQVGEFSFDARHWRRVSDHAKDLVKRCLTYVPGKRITAAEALQHPWIQCYTGAGAGLKPDRPISVQLGGDLIERFKAFQRLHKLKKLAITCVAYQLSDADIGTLHDAFAALDTNADGVLTVAELKQGLKQCCVAGDDINEILKEMDTDGNGTIDYTEFIAASIDHKIYEQESACQAAFKVFDLDGDGKITVEELQKVLETRYVQQAFSKEAVADMLKEADANNDGCIDFDEFMRMMRGRQRKVSDSSSPLARARALLYRRYEG